MAPNTLPEWARLPDVFSEVCLGTAPIRQDEPARGHASSPEAPALPSDYARRAVAIVDDEGEMARYLSTAAAAGEIDKANVMLFHDSLEGENTTTAGLIALAQHIAESPPADREPVSFELTVRELESDHADRRERTSRNGKPGIADSLIILVGRKTDGRVRLDKLEPVEAIANVLIDEFQSTPRDQLPALLERRPVIKFFLKRIEPVLNRAIPAGREI